jgi:hypothetical protein
MQTQMQTQNKLLVYLLVVFIAITFSLPYAWAALKGGGKVRQVAE